MPAPNDLERALGHLAAAAATVLGDQHVGACALAAGPEGVTLLVVIRDRLPPAAVAALGDLHAGRSGGRELPAGVAYPDAAGLRSPMTLGRRWPYAAPGATVLGESASLNTASTRWLLRERAVVLDGPEPRTFVAEVAATALRAEALGEARVLAEQVDDDLPRLADARHRRVTVLTACRVLHTAVRAEVADAATAAAWVLATPGALDPAHHPVVAEALDGLDGPDEAVPVDADRPARVRALLWDVALLAGEAALGGRLRSR